MSKKPLDYISDHTLNKDMPNAIVYRDAEGEITLLTEEDFSCREEFLKWKKWSNASYKKQERSDRKYSYHKAPLYEHDCPVPSAEEIIFGIAERKEREKEEDIYDILLARAFDTLNPLQQERFCLKYGERFSNCKIAELEGVDESTVRRALEAIDRKIEKYICKFSVKTSPNLAVFSVLGEGGNNSLSLKLENRIDSVKGTKPA